VVTHPFYPHYELVEGVELGGRDLELMAALVAYLFDPLDYRTLIFAVLLSLSHFVPLDYRMMIFAAPIKSMIQVPMKIGMTYVHLHLVPPS